MLEYKLRINESVFIRWQGTSIDTGLYPQVKVYNIDSPTTVVTTLNLPHLANGLYGVKWTPTIAGKYFTQTIIYSTDYGIDESGIDRPDSDSINVETSSGSGGYLLGAGQQQTYSYKGLTEDELSKIIDGVVDKLKLDIVESTISIKEFISKIETKDYSNDLKKILEAVLGIKFDYEFDDSQLIKLINLLANKIDVNNAILMESFSKALNREIKIEKYISNVVDSEKILDTENEDMDIAVKIFNNPELRFKYAKEKKLNEKVINHLLCLRSSS